MAEASIAYNKIREPDKNVSHLSPRGDSNYTIFLIHEHKSIYFYHVTGAKKVQSARRFWLVSNYPVCMPKRYVTTTTSVAL